MAHRREPEKKKKADDDERNDSSYSIKARWRACAEDASVSSGESDMLVQGVLRRTLPEDFDQAFPARAIRVIASQLNLSRETRLACARLEVFRAHCRDTRGRCSTLCHRVRSRGQGRTERVAHRERRLEECKRHPYSSNLNCTW